MLKDLGMTALKTVVSATVGTIVSHYVRKAITEAEQKAKAAKAVKNG